MCRFTSYKKINQKKKQFLHSFYIQFPRKRPQFMRGLSVVQAAYTEIRHCQKWTRESLDNKSSSEEDITFWMTSCEFLPCMLDPLSSNQFLGHLLWFSCKCVGFLCNPALGSLVELHSQRAINSWAHHHFDSWAHGCAVFKINIHYSAHQLREKYWWRIATIYTVISF